MKIVFDTNIIVDAVALREPFCESAKKLLLMVSEEKISGYVTANSLTDIFYVVRHKLPEEKAREIIRSLLYSLDVIEVGEADCWQALNLPVDDFEDALLAACAEKIGADFIISRDAGFVKSGSPVRVIDPDEFLLNVIDVRR